MSELENKQRDAARQRRRGLLFNRELPTTNQEGETKMAKTPNESGVNRHKRMAMGEKVELKKGGAVKKAAGGCMKKGGAAKKKK